MLDQTYTLPHGAQEVLGDLSALAQQLGETGDLDGLCALASWEGSYRIRDARALGAFLTQFTSAILIPHELPAVVRAHACATHFQPRELIALDKELTLAPPLRPFARASTSVGRAQLRRLRPLRGERIMSRYFDAVQSGQAHGWHTVVFGLVLGLYSLPLRQGLVHFGQRTLGGFVEAARQGFTVTEAECEQLLEGPRAALRDGVAEALRTEWPALPLAGPVSSDSPDS
jgi:urease accessory protein UreF